MCHDVALVQIAGDLLGILYAIQHKMDRAVADGVHVDGHALRIRSHDELHQLVVVVEALQAVIARLVKVVLKLPGRVRLDDAV